MRRATSPRTSKPAPASHGHPRRRRHPARADDAAAHRRRLDRDDAGHLRLGRAGLLHHHAAGQEPVLLVLGIERVVGARGAAALHLDGRDPVPQPPLGGDVRGPRALAEPDSRPADAHHHPRLRHLRLGLGLVGGDLRDHQQGRPARAPAPRLRREDRARLARHRRHARHPDPAVDHDGGLRRRRRRLDHPHLPRRLPAGLAADGPVLRLHRLVGAEPSGKDAAGRSADEPRWPRSASRAT